MRHSERERERDRERETETETNRDRERQRARERQRQSQLMENRFTDFKGQLNGLIVCISRFALKQDFPIVKWLQ